MNEDQQKILKNFTTLEEDLMDSDQKEDFSILREAWNIEISKPGCTQCLKNGAMSKYTQIATNMILHNLSIEEAKGVLDLRTELKDIKTQLAGSLAHDKNRYGYDSNESET